MALFRKLKGYELSDKVFVLEVHHLRVAWQLLSKFYVRILFVLLDRAKMHNGALERFVSYRFVCILLCIDC